MYIYIYIYVCVCVCVSLSFWVGKEAAPPVFLWKCNDFLRAPTNSLWNLTLSQWKEMKGKEKKRKGTGPWALNPNESLGFDKEFAGFHLNPSHVHRKSGDRFLSDQHPYMEESVTGERDTRLKKPVEESVSWGRDPGSDQRSKIKDCHELLDWPGLPQEFLAIFDLWSLIRPTCSNVDLSWYMPGRPAVQIYAYLLLIAHAYLH